MRRIATSVEGLRLPRGVAAEGLWSLPPRERAWVETTTARLLAAQTGAERAAADMLATLREKPVRQAFFKIRGRRYFLDFFFKGMMLAVEIDGSSHKARRDRDRRRDADVRSIGIRTIRIKNKAVREGRLYEKLFKRLNR